jgi:lambda family phage portal protein
LSVDPEIEALLGPVGSPGSAAPPPAVIPTAVGGGDSAIVGGAYDGANRFDDSLMLWGPALQSADREILPEKSGLDARVRDTLRNDAYVAGGAAIHKDNIVGSCFMLNAKPASKVLGLDETWEAEFQEEVETKFMLAAESPNNWFDAAAMNTLTDLVRLAVGVFVAGGEVLATAEWLRDPGRPFNTAIQMVDTDRLTTPWGEIEGPLMRGGVARNRYGAPQGYHIRNAHPTDPTASLDAMTWTYVPARKPWGRLQVLHIIEQMRPDQTRGIAAMVASLKTTQIAKRFRDVVLQNAVVQSTYAASIESDLPSETVFAQMGAGNAGDGIEGAIVNYAQAYLAAVAKYSGGAKNMKLDGVKIPHLFPGTKLQMHPAGSGGPLGTEFEQSLLRHIAANLGVSYEQLSHDYSKTNYSSARAAMNETYKYMQSRKRKVADRTATTVFRLWLEEAINKGQITSLPKNAPSWYDGLNADAYCQCEWIGASRGQIDELKETQAAILRLKFGLSTREDEIARFGKDWRRVFRQLEREDTEANVRKLQFSTDANAMKGLRVAPNGTDGGSQDGNQAIGNVGTADALFLDAPAEEIEDAA